MIRLVHQWHNVRLWSEIFLISESYEKSFGNISMKFVPFWFCFSNYKHKYNAYIEPFVIFKRNISKWQINGYMSCKDQFVQILANIHSQQYEERDQEL